MPSRGTTTQKHRHRSIPMRSRVSPGVARGVKGTDKGSAQLPTCRTRHRVVRTPVTMAGPAIGQHEHVQPPATARSSRGQRPHPGHRRRPLLPRRQHQPAVVAVRSPRHLVLGTTGLRRRRQDPARTHHRRPHPRHPPPNVAARKPDRAAATLRITTPLPVRSVPQRSHARGGEGALPPPALAGRRPVTPSGGGRGGEEREEGRWEAAKVPSRRLRGRLGRGDPSFSWPPTKYDASDSAHPHQSCT